MVDRTRDKTKTGFKLNTEPTASQPLATRPGQRAGLADPRNTQTSKAQARAKTSGMTPTDDMRDMLNKLRDIEMNDLDDDDDEGYDDSETPENLPATVTVDNLPKIMSNELADSGVVNPAWLKVSDLPGNISRVIRSIGRQLFGEFTNTKTDDIYMIGNLSGMGPHSQLEVRSVAKWVHDNGTFIEDADIDFSQIMPGYTASTKLYDAAGIRWMLTSDAYGTYIYSWPQGDSKRSARQLK